MTSMVEDLLDPRFLPDRTTGVKLIQTHISWVFVADQFVYKVKKPVDFGFLDFSTLSRREYFCRQEVELNQRLSKDIYLEVLPILYDGRHHWMGNGGPGEIVEYAVKMRRIPEEMLMKSRFQSGALTESDLRDISHVLAAFHGGARRSKDIDSFGEIVNIRVNTDENFVQTRAYIHRTLEDEDFHFLRNWTDDFYRENSKLFSARILEGKIRDCHGDLHMEHICMTHPVSVIDCIEFNERFRYGDTICDIAFLLMDLDFHGGKGQADRIWEFYAGETGEKGVESLLVFYKVYRAYVRGKVISFQLDDDRLTAEQKGQAAGKAARYFRLARSYLS